MATSPEMGSSNPARDAASSLFANVRSSPGRKAGTAWNRSWMLSSAKPWPWTSPARNCTTPFRKSSANGKMEERVSDQPVVRTRGLTRYFGAKAAVYELDLQVPPGSVFAFLGRNGSGKTTTIRMLLGLLQPTRGEGQILGYDIQ